MGLTTPPPLVRTQQAVFSWLQHTLITDLLLHRQQRKRLKTMYPTIIDIYEEATLKEAITIMNRYRLLALPVYRYEADPLEQQYIGIVTLADILSFTVFQKVFDDLDLYHLDASVYDPRIGRCVDESASFEQYLRTLDDQERFANTQVRDLCGLTAESAAFTTLSSKDTLANLLLTFGHVHRAIVRDPENPNNVAMISQTDLVDFVLEMAHMEDKLHLQEILSTTVDYVAEYCFKRHHGSSQVDSDANQPVQLQRPAVIEVPYNYTAISAFRVMHSHRVSAVAVVDPSQNHRLVANLSASDLRGITFERMEDLLLPIPEFLDTMRRSLSEKSKHPGPLVTVSPHTDLGTAMTKALQYRIHGIWILGKDPPQTDRPVGAITFSDFLSMLVPE
ncbi:hypothetical protein HK102_003074, partial [Quaeritorhiza haematococci]